MGRGGKVDRENASGGLFWNGRLDVVVFEDLCYPVSSDSLREVPLQRLSRAKRFEQRAHVLYVDSKKRRKRAAC